MIPIHQNTYIAENNFTQDPAVLNSSQYQRIISVIDKMRSTGVMNHAAGNCIAISEILQHLLIENEVPCRLVECRLMITEKRNGMLSEFKYIGWDGSSIANADGAIDTHVVVVTEGESPILIDLSVAHVLPKGRVWVAEPLNSLAPERLVEFWIDESKIVYELKKQPRLLGLHQSSLLERLRTDQKILSQQSSFQLMLYAVIVACVINLVLNTSQLIFRAELTDRLHSVEEMLIDTIKDTSNE